MAFIQLPYWLIYYSWRPNRPRRNWTLQRTICARMFRRFTRLPTTAGLLTNRDLSLAVPQKKLRWYNSRFVWVPELEKEGIVGMVAEHATRAGVKSIAIPAYWILKDGAEWSPEYEKAREDEKVVLYFHGGAFIVRFSPSSHPAFMLTTFVTGGDRAPISSDIICPQGNAQTFYISLPSAVGRLPTQFRASLRTQEPVPSCSH